MQVITKFVQDQAGNLMPNATGTLYYAGTDQLVTGLQDIDGAALANPMRSDARGMLQFSAPTGNYDLNVRKGSSTYTVRVQVIDVDEAQQAAASASASADDARESAAIFQQDIGGRNVTTYTGSQTLEASLNSRAKRSMVVFMASDYGAIEGENITESLQELAEDARELGSGFSIVIDVKRAKVFKQEVNETPGDGRPYYVTKGDILNLSGCSNFTLDMSQCELTTEPGLRFGSFDPISGDVADSRKTSKEYGVSIGTVVNLDGCSNYEVVSPRLYGNNENLIIGNEYGDTGYQLTHIGIREFNVSNSVITNPVCDYFALDGMYLGGELTDGVTHVNPSCGYNGRQGISWTGGTGFTTINPKYRFTGMGGIRSLPSAGIDLEDNGAGCHDMVMINPSIYGNYGSDFLSLNTTSNINVYGGVIAGASRSLWVDSYGVKFYGTSILGQIIKVTSRTEFIGTVHEDREYKGVKLDESETLIEGLSSGGAIWRDAEIICNRQNILFLQGDGEMHNTKIRLRADNPAPRSRDGVYDISLMSDVEFIQEYRNIDPLTETSGEHVYLGNIRSTDRFAGRCEVRGNSLAEYGRSGRTNVILTRGEKTSPYTDIYTHVTSGNSDEIPLSTGVGIVTITSGNYMIVAMQASTGSSNAYRHGTVIISEAQGANGGITFGVGVSGGADVITVADGNDQIDGMEWTVSKLALGPIYTLPI